MYVPGNLPIDAPQWLVQELQSISQSWGQPMDLMQLTPRHAAPQKLRDGMIALADGADWNPGAGAGFYGYYG